MSTDPQEAGAGSTTPAPEPTDTGHRARAYAATLLGELTGSRRAGGSAPEDAPTGPGSRPTSAGAATAPASAPAPSSDAGAPTLQKTQSGPSSVPDLTASTLRADAQVERAAPASRANGDLRPAPFTYAEVALHHTGPARERAGAVLDACGPRISAGADREQVRRAARTAVEAAALLDACDALDARAGAVDATWTGERYGATEIREFEGAWSGYYDTAQALSAHG